MKNKILLGLSAIALGISAPLNISHANSIEETRVFIRAYEKDDTIAYIVETDGLGQRSLIFDFGEFDGSKPGDAKAKAMGEFITEDLGEFTRGTYNLVAADDGSTKGRSVIYENLDKEENDRFWPYFATKEDAAKAGYKIRVAVADKGLTRGSQIVGRQTIDYSKLPGKKVTDELIKGAKSNIIELTVKPGDIQRVEGFKSTDSPAVEPLTTKEQSLAGPVNVHGELKTPTPQQENSTENKTTSKSKLTVEGNNKPQQKKEDEFNPLLFIPIGIGILAVFSAGIMLYRSRKGEKWWKNSIKYTKHLKC